MLFERPNDDINTAMVQKLFFLAMIQHLRAQEEVFMYGYVLESSPEEQQRVVDFLGNEYKRESWEYPQKIPVFDSHAALWAAELVYRSSQLLLYREHKVNDLSLLLPSFSGLITPSAILSADLVLRFLPAIIAQLKIIDEDDPLIRMLEEQLSIWHYSALSYPLHVEKLNFDTILTNQCLYRLYINRIIDFKKISFAQHPVFYSQVKASLGLFDNIFWKEFSTISNEPR
ncbi:MAG: hypothetical protein ACK41O_10800 [Runella zeae]